MFHRACLMAALIHVFSRRLVPDELRAGHRMLTLSETPEMLFANLTMQSPLLGKPSMPFAMNLVRFGVVVLAGIAKLFRVVCLRLACT